MLINDGSRPEAVVLKAHVTCVVGCGGNPFAVAPFNNLSFKTFQQHPAGDIELVVHYNLPRSVEGFYQARLVVCLRPTQGVCCRQDCRALVANPCMVLAAAGTHKHGPIMMLTACAHCRFVTYAWQYCALQESGRAGRNGQPASSVLMYSTRDRRCERKGKLISK